MNGHIPPGGLDLSAMRSGGAREMRIIPVANVGIVPNGLSIGDSIMSVMFLDVNNSVAYFVPMNERSARVVRDGLTDLLDQLQEA
jgi:hypothetical protein